MSASQLVDAMDMTIRMDSRTYQRRRERFMELTKPPELIPGIEFEAMKVMRGAEFPVSERFNVINPHMNFEYVSDAFLGTFGHIAEIRPRPQLRVQAFDLPERRAMMDEAVRADLYMDYLVDLGVVSDALTLGLQGREILKFDTLNVFYVPDDHKEVWAVIVRIPSDSGRIFVNAVKYSDPGPWQGPMRFFSRMPRPRSV